MTLEKQGNGTKTVKHPPDFYEILDFKESTRNLYDSEITVDVVDTFERDGFVAMVCRHHLIDSSQGCANGFEIRHESHLLAACAGTFAMAARSNLRTHTAETYLFFYSFRINHDAKVQNIYQSQQSSSWLQLSPVKLMQGYDVTPTGSRAG